ncbi:MAG: hypothetical protein AAB481_02510 [Patescibacteria group bacterium]
MGRRSRFVIGVLIVLWLAFFWRQIVGGEVWYCCDNLLINIPARVFQAQELAHGRFSLWNPYIFSGTPFFADINLAVLHPLNLLYLVLPPFQALTWGILLLFLVGSVGMYFLGRTLTLGRFASLVGAVVFGFSGSLIVYANNITIFQVAVLVPWVLATWIRYLGLPTGKRLVVFVLASGFQIISGHPQLTFYTWLMLGAYAIFEKSKSQPVIKAALFVGLVTSVQVIPFLWFALNSTRVGNNLGVAGITAIHPLSLVRLIIPGIVGDLSRGTAWIQAGSMHGYVGFLPLLLLPFAWKSRAGKFFFAVGVTSLFLSVGTYAVAWFREPSQFLFFWSFGLAGSTMAALDNNLAGKARQNRYILIVSLMFLIMASVPWEYLPLPGFFPERLLIKIASLPWQQRRIISDSLLYNFSLFGALGIFAAAIIGRLKTSLVAKTLLLGVLFVDLYVYGQTNVTTIEGGVARGWLEKQRIAIASWKLDADNYRYYTDPALYPYPGKIPFGQFNDPGESEWQLRILRPSTGMMFRLSAVDGYASMVLSSYQRKFGGSVLDSTGVVISSIVDSRLGEAGVRYIITKPNNPLLFDTKRYRILAVDGEIAIYEDSKAVPIMPLEETE